MGQISTHAELAESLREGVRYWMSDDPKIRAEIAAYCQKQETEQEALRQAGYILIYNGVPYKESDILEGKCPANGTLYHMNYRSNGDGTWRKATEEEIKNG